MDPVKVTFFSILVNTSVIFSVYFYTDCWMRFLADSRRGLSDRHLAVKVDGNDKGVSGKTLPGVL